MGPAQVAAAGLYARGAAGTLPFEAFPFRGAVATSNATGEVTDSAAAGTALATGVKVGNGVVAVALPGDGRPLETIPERFAAAGGSVGLVTTAFVVHATPAAFAAHESDRDRYDAIAADILDGSRPRVLFGGGLYVTAAAAAAAGYAVVDDAAALRALNTGAAVRVAGLFGSGHFPFEADGLGDLPPLREMTRVALQILDDDPDGFFLMVEGGLIDHACHANDIGRAVVETVAFGRAVEEAMAWAAGRSDTLVLVTADHETGGLAVLSGNGAGAFPEVTWSTSGHTGADVPVYALGPCAGSVAAARENTDLHGIMASAAFGPACP